MQAPLVTAPWDLSTVQTLNLMQVGAADSQGHPYTCPNRTDTHHGAEGGDVGLLVATLAGWVCPWCDYEQDWAIPPTTIVQPIALIGNGRIELLAKAHQAEVRERIGPLVQAYEAMAAAGFRGVEFMVEALASKARELDNTNIESPPELWVVYQRPIDFPVECVVRKFDALGRPTDTCVTAPNLELLREAMPSSATVIPRHHLDEPQIVEMWLIPTEIANTTD